MSWTFSRLLYLLSFISLAVLLSQGYNGCRDETWLYYSSSHTCFRKFSDLKSWSEAKTKCENFSEYNKNTRETAYGRLAKIPNIETYNFVKDHVLHGSSAWIGLNKIACRTGAFWYWAFHDDTPKEANWVNWGPGVNWCRLGVFFKNDGWNADWKTNDKEYICQQDAVIKVKMSCPKSPVQANTVPDKAPTCEFNFKHWSSFLWGKSGGYHYGCDNQMACYNNGTGYDANLDQNNELHTSYSGQITTQHNGTWDCTVNNMNHTHSETSSCNLQIYEPANDIECYYQPSLQFLLVSCTTKKIFPTATCQWSYKYLDANDYTQLNETFYITDNHHDVINEESQELYYTSNCTVRLKSSEELVFKDGILTVQVTMLPDVRDLSLPNDARRTAETVVAIDIPPKPVFQFFKKDVGNSLYLEENDVIDLRCVVTADENVILKTTLFCGFPITSAGNFLNTVWGNSYVLTAKAQRGMNTKTCSCWGVHFTGNTERSILTFHFSYPAKITSFHVDGEKRKEVELNTKVSLTCQASGNPIPTIEIRKDKEAKNNNWKNHLQISASDGTNNSTLETKCTDNGKYQCYAQNLVKSISQVAVMDLNIRVKCPPTPCNRHENVSFQIRPGQQPVFSVCAVAYPLPEKDKFKLHKANGDGWVGNIPDRQYTIAIEGSSDYMESVKITFLETQSSHEGAYRLAYADKTNDKFLYLNFSITEIQSPPSSTNVVIPIAIAVAVVIVVVIIIIVLGVVFWKRRSRKKKPKSETLDESGTKVGDQKKRKATSTVTVSPKKSTEEEVHLSPLDNIYNNEGGVVNNAYRNGASELNFEGNTYANA